MATTLAQVRTLTGLTTAEVSDDELTTLLELNDDAVKLAAADALEIFAGRLSTITVTSDDISLDGSKRATALLTRASRLRDQHVEALAEGEFFTDTVFDGCGAPELTERGCC